MGKKKVNYDQLFSQMLNQWNQSLAQLNQKSPTEQALENEVMNVINWKNAGDFRNPPKSIFFNRAPVAERRRQRELMGNASGMGISALGQANPTITALNKQNMDAEFEEDMAGQHEADVANAVQAATGLGQGVAAGDLARKQAALGASTSMTGNAMSIAAQQKNKPKWWQSLLGSGISAAASFI